MQYWAFYKYYSTLQYVQLILGFNPSPNAMTANNCRHTTLTCRHLRYLNHSVVSSATHSCPGCGSSRVALMSFLPNTSLSSMPGGFWVFPGQNCYVMPSAYYVSAQGSPPLWCAREFLLQALSAYASSSPRPWGWAQRPCKGNKFSLLLSTISSSQWVPRADHRWALDQLRDQRRALPSGSAFTSPWQSTTTPTSLQALHRYTCHSQTLSYRH